MCFVFHVGYRSTIPPPLPLILVLARFLKPSAHRSPSPASVEVLLRSKIAQLEGKGKRIQQAGGDPSGGCAGKAGSTRASRSKNVGDGDRGCARRKAAGGAGVGGTTAYEEDRRNDVMKQFERQVNIYDKQWSGFGAGEGRATSRSCYSVKRRIFCPRRRKSYALDAVILQELFHTSDEGTVKDPV